MGRLTGGAFGPVYGKVGGTVGSNWKGINTLRQYAIPANPQSIDQTAQRTKFKAVSLLAINLIPTLITSFWNMFAVKMSGYNYFIKQAFPGASSTGLALPGMQVTKGSLEPITNLAVTYNTANGSLSGSFDSTILGNGLATDDVFFLALRNTDNQVLAYRDTTMSRDDGTFSANIDAGLTATQITVYLWATRGTGSELMVSNSIGDICAAP